MIFFTALKLTEIKMKYIKINPWFPERSRKRVWEQVEALPTVIK